MVHFSPMSSQPGQYVKMGITPLYLPPSVLPSPASCPTSHSVPHLPCFRSQVSFPLYAFVLPSSLTLLLYLHLRIHLSHLDLLLVLLSTALGECIASDSTTLNSGFTWRLGRPRTQSLPWVSIHNGPLDGCTIVCI